MRLLLAGVAIAVVLFFSVGLLALYWLQGRLIYPGERRTRARALDFNPRFVWVSVMTIDGLAITCRYCPAQAGGTLAVLLLHGNGGDLHERAAIAERLADEGYAVLQAEYRGFAGNPGSPSEQGLYADGRAALELLESTGLAVVIHGYSLGSGVAVQLASERACAGLILEAPFTSIPSAAQARLPWLPVHSLIRDRYDSLSKIAGVHAPLLIYGGDGDRVIPNSHFRELCAAANEPRQLVTIKDAGHTGLWEAGGEHAVVAFLQQRASERQRPTA